MATPIELLVVLFTSFLLNLIPFAGPSNLFIASNSALILGVTDPANLVVIGFLVALGAALAKSIHYLVTFFISKHLSAKQQERLNAEALRIKPWAFILLFVAAATPIPDEPVVIPVGLLKYNPAKFFLAFFLGKLSITIVGAFLGSFAGRTFSSVMTPEVTIALSIVLTIVITVILLKVDLGKLVEKILGRKIGAEIPKESQAATGYPKQKTKNRRQF